MTYGVERMTFQGKTLHEKLRAQYGERAAKSVRSGLEANSRKKVAREAAKTPESAKRSREKGREASSAAGRRTVTSVMRTVGPRSAGISRACAVSHATDGATRRLEAPARAANAASQARGRFGDAPQPRTSVRAASAPQGNARVGAAAPQANARVNAAAPQGSVRSNAATSAQSASRESGRRYELPRQSHFANAREMYETRNPYRVRVNYFKKPVTGRSDLEVSIATFSRAYRAGMRAQRTMGAGMIRDRSAQHAAVRTGYRKGDVRSDRSAYENSVGVMANAYRRGERMRRLTQIEKAKPTPKSEVETKASHRFFARVRSILGVKGSHTAELRLKKTPFPIGTVALMAVCTLVMMVMISSFAQLSECRAQISDLEYRQDKLALERTRLTGLVESREDIRVIEKIATQDIGMVSAELAKGRFVSLADCDRVEVIEDTPEEESGVFATILSAISENLGAISEYIN